MCQWRRSLRLAVQADKIYDRLTSDGYKHVFVTLTVRNCNGSDLSEQVDAMYEALTRMTRQTSYKRAVAGAYVALEVTYNKASDTYHPHFHCIWTVSGDYFRKDNPDYINKDKLIQMWRKAARLDYAPSVDIEAVKQKEGQTLTSACVEACKYPVKSAEISFSSTLQVIDYALRGRRLIRWTGVAADVRRQLRLEDVESGDLVHTDDVAPELNEQTIRIAYAWRYGFYIPIDYKRLDT